MLDFLYKLNDTTIFFLMVIITTFFSLIIIFINRVFKLYQLKYRDNTAAAGVASMIGIIYGLLTGILCLYLLNNQDHAQNAALNEGIAAANMYRESQWLKGPLQKQMQTDLTNYINDVVQNEWPVMSKGGEIDIHTSAVRYVKSMSITLMHYPIANQADYLIVNNLLQAVRDLYKARQERIELSNSQLSLEIWLVVLLSSALLIFMTHTLRIHFKLHVLSLTAMAIMTASVLFLLVTLDRPFQGEFVVAPKALQAVLHLMEQDH